MKEGQSARRREQMAAPKRGWMAFQHFWAVIEITCFGCYFLLLEFPAGAVSWPRHPLAQEITQHHFELWMTGRHSPVLGALFIVGGLGLAIFVPAWPRGDDPRRRSWCFVVVLSAVLVLVYIVAPGATPRAVE